MVPLWIVYIPETAIIATFVMVQTGDSNLKPCAGSKRRLKKILSFAALMGATSNEICKYEFICQCYQIWEDNRLDIWHASCNICTSFIWTSSDVQPYYSLPLIRYRRWAYPVGCQLERSTLFHIVTMYWISFLYIMLSSHFFFSILYYFSLSVYILK